MQKPLYATDDLAIYPDFICVKVVDKTVIPTLRNVPCVQEVSVGEHTLFTMPRTDDACRLLINLGYKATPGVRFFDEEHASIEGKYPPLMHQLFTAGYIIAHPRCYVLNDCRLGKTGSAILALDYLQRTHAFTGGILVITTVTTMSSVWRPSILSTLADTSCVILHGSDKLAKLQKQYDWYVTNYDSIRLNIDAFNQAVQEQRIGAVLIDELTHVGNSTSQRHRAIYQLVNGNAMRFVVGMTGSPGAKPDPVFGMARIINPGNLPCQTKTGWVNMTTYSYGPQPFMRRPIPDVGKIIHSTMLPAVRFKKEDVLDLPPVTYQTRSCSLSQEQMRILKALREEAVALTQSGEVISAANAGILVNKILQAVLGFNLIKDATVTYTIGSRNQTIIDIISETVNKVVVFSMFRHRLQTLEKSVKEAGYTVARIDGGVTGKDRARILRDFTDQGKPHVLVCHPTTVGFGTELSRADTLVLDGPPLLGNFSYMQTLERLSSPKQKSDHISIIKVAACREERFMFDKLDNGHTAGQVVAAMFEPHQSPLAEDME